MNFWDILLYQPLLNLLVFFYKTLFFDFGLAIIALTVLIRAVLIPVTIPALRSSKKMMDLKPKLDELKKRYGHDKKLLQQEQLKLYKEQGVNPAAGCLPWIVQIIVLIALYQVFIKFLGGDGKIDGQTINTAFLWLNLAKPDPFVLLPVLAGVAQFFLSKMMMTSQAKQAVIIKKDDKKEDMADMAQAMQKQMMYIFPVMTVFIAWQLPSGLALYWFVTTVFSIIQQYYVTGWGSLKEWLPKKLIGETNK